VGSIPTSASKKTMKNVTPPTDLFEQLLSITPPGEKVLVPNKRSELVSLRENLVKTKTGTPADFEYIDMLLECEKQGKVEFEPESN